MTERLYQDKPAEYYGLVRREIAPLLPRHAERVLEIGCGCGATLAWLKQQGRASWTAGVELNTDAARRAAEHLDCLYPGDIGNSAALASLPKMDVILCLDVLEHLADPWLTLQQLKPLLKPDGLLIVSLPNVRHHSVLLPLLLQGRWQYQQAGIMDKSHLRFFSRASAQDLLQDSGFVLLQQRSTYAWGSWDGWKDKLSLGLLNGFFSFQYLLVARPARSA